MIRITMPIKQDPSIDEIIERCASVIKAIQAQREPADGLDTIIDTASTMIQQVQVQRRSTPRQEQETFGSTYEIAGTMAGLLVDIAAFADRYRLWPLIHDHMSQSVARARASLQGTVKEAVAVEP